MEGYFHYKNSWNLFIEFLVQWIGHTINRSDFNNLNKIFICYSTDFINNNVLMITQCYILINIKCKTLDTNQFNNLNGKHLSLNLNIIDSNAGRVIAAYWWENSNWDKINIQSANFHSYLLQVQYVM